MKLGWDEDIPLGQKARWLVWLKDLPKLVKLHVQRCYKPAGLGTIKSAKIHHFADASEVGYGLVSYLRLTNGDGRVHCAFLMGKARVSLLKRVTIPRLELTAATVSANMDAMLQRELCDELALGKSVLE
ncbi:PREDICTED: uncharacterized protein LOC106819622 [Priapulus caudatus]|uniref:Uncharacterized protein LOC106819622 n=1 Tax=Priapulus caudatus TaxID=37621 RepID=A0ABM1F5J6_PRICU|nr:PREDICTED: uncharacterized protein LOC106819622 [Priapulus caudatus]